MIQGGDSLATPCSQSERPELEVVIKIIVRRAESLFRFRIHRKEETLGAQTIGS